MGHIKDVDTYIIKKIKNSPKECNKFKKMSWD